MMTWQSPVGPGGQRSNGLGQVDFEKGVVVLPWVEKKTEKICPRPLPISQTLRNSLSSMSISKLDLRMNLWL